MEGEGRNDVILLPDIVMNVRVTSELG